MPSLLHQSIPQQPLLPRTSSWAVDLMGGRSSAAADPMMGQSPWLAGVQTSRVSSPFVPEPAKADDILDLHSSMVTGILNEDFGRQSAPQSSQSALDVNLFAAVEKAVEPTEPAVEAPAAVEEDTTTAVANKIAETYLDETAAAVAAPKPVEQPVVVEEVKVKEPEVKQEEEAEKVPGAEKTEEVPPVLAPWGKAAEAKPVVTLKQIQELEAERLQRERQLKAELRAQMQQESLLANKIEEKAQEKVAFNWANTPSQAVTKETLADIQRAEAQAAKAKAKLTTPKLSLADTLTSAPKEETSAWTTVATKKAPAPKKAVLMAYTPSGSSLNPLVLRAASSSANNTSSVVVSSVREDFMVWARAALTNLYPSVSKSDLLEVFTTLPAHNDSAQLIAETIYSSSATMDGRRFAQEFMKKRQQVEREVGNDGQSWSAAIASSANKVPSVDDDGWSTNVKSKKKGKRN